MNFVSSLLPRCTFPPEGTEVTCAVSGGADSLALLVLAVESGCRVTAIHVDHGLRANSMDEAHVVEEAAERFGATFVSKTVAVSPGPNMEERARLARYGVLPDGVMTGHTADDQAETVLLNMLRGSGLEGLSGMQYDSRHPLLRIRRSETHLVCQEVNLVPVIDPSNNHPAILRNRVRHELVPLLDDIAKRDVSAVISRQSVFLRDDAAFLNEEASNIDPTDCNALMAAPPALARRAIRTWLKDLDGMGHGPDSACVERVMQVARGEAKGCDLSGGASVRRSRRRLRLIPGGSGDVMVPPDD